MYVKLPDIIIVRNIEKPRKKLIFCPLKMGRRSGKSDAEKLSSTTTFSFFSCQRFSPPPDIVGHGGTTVVEAIAPPPPDYSGRDPLFTRENLLWESPVGLSSRSAYVCLSGANLAGWTVCPLGILTDECKLNCLAFSFQSGSLCCVLSRSASGVTLNNRRKHFPVSEVEFCTVFITCKKSGVWLCFVSHRPETNKQTKTYVEGSSSPRVGVFLGV